MRVLLDDVLSDAVIDSASNASPNYPAKNLIHPFLRKRYQFERNYTPLEYDTIVDIKLNGVKSINCVFLAYHDLNALSVSLLNQAGTTVLATTGAIDDPDDMFIHYFSSLIEDVGIVRISASGSYIGKIAVGEYIQFPDLVAQYDTGLGDNSSLFESAQGQTLVNKIDPLRVLSYSIRELEGNTMLLNYRNKPMFFDLYENARWKEAPIYARITTPFSLGYNPRRYDLANLTIKECR